ncbi:MAG: RICIN domain-containing protein [Marinifilaceae bacterium]|jgi:hypothetical protein|nr:RICIN domain-containing protein [Marinifilaceae bacterium]
MKNLIALAVIILTCAFNSNAQVYNGSVVTLKYKMGGCCLDVAGGSKERGANIQVWTPNGLDPQKFKLISNGGDRYFLQNINGGKFVDIVNGEQKTGVNIRTWDGNMSLAQTFIIVPTNNKGYYYLKSTGGYYVGVETSYAQKGSNVILLASATGSTEWKIEFAK